MRYKLDLSDEARETIRRLAAQNDRKVDKVRKALALMETNIKHQGLHTHSYDSITGNDGEKVFIKHQGLHTHSYDSITGNDGEKVFEAYVENHTPGAYRIYWHYGPGQGVITVLAITPHP